MVRAVAVVPMKLTNRRLPNKNTKSFTEGKPLCWYILSTLLEVKGIDSVYVYCSNPDIQEFIPNNVRYLRRSENLDTDETSMNEVLKAFAGDVEAETYLMTHATAPFISVKSLQTGLDAVLGENEYDSSLAVKCVQDFLWKDGKPFNYSLSNIPRTQDLEKLYQETSGFFIYKRDTIIAQNRRIGDRPYMVEVSEIESMDIDEEEDFIIADAVQYYLKHFGRQG